MHMAIAWVFAGFAAGLLHTGLGVGYALAALSLTPLLGVSVNEVVAEVLLSQIVVAAVGVGLGRREVSGFIGGWRGFAVLGLACLAAYVAALLVGVRVESGARLLFTGLLLLLSSYVTLAGRGGGEGAVRGSHLLAAGLAAGVVKAIVGAGLTPVVYVVSRVLGSSLSAAVYRAFVVELSLGFFVAAPYVLYYGVEPLVLLGMVAGGVVGGWLGWVFLGGSGRAVLRERLAFAVMLVLGVYSVGSSLQVLWDVNLLSNLLDD